MREHLLRIVALDHHVAAAVVADRQEEVAVGQRLDREAVLRRVLPKRQGLAIGRDRGGRKCQPQHVLAGRQGIERRVGNPALAVANRADHRTATHDVVLAGRAERFRLPGEHLQHLPERPGMGQVEHRVHDRDAVADYHDAAVDAVFHHAGLMGVVGGQDALPAGDLPGPGVVGQRRIAGPRGRHVHRRILQRLAAAVARLGKGPRPGVDVARRTRIDARAAEEQREEIADVGLPLRKGLAAVHHVLGRVARHRAGVDGIVPVPEVMAERRIAAPLGQQDVAEIPFSGVAGLEQGVVLGRGSPSRITSLRNCNVSDIPAVACVSQLAILGVGVTVPGHRAGRRSQCSASRSAQCLTAAR